MLHNKTDLQQLAVNMATELVAAETNGKGQSRR